MDQTDLRLCRSLLFLPGVQSARDREGADARRRHGRPRPRGCGERDEDKAAAREAAVAAIARGLRRPAGRDPGQSGRHRRIMARTSSRSATAAADFVVLAKAESAKQVHDAGWLMGKPVLAMIETPRGGDRRRRDRAGLAPALIAGTNDLAAALGLAAGAGRRGLVYALQRIVLAARAAGVAAFDGVYNRLEADEGLAAECAEGRAFGFDGKSVIHPSQIETANRAVRARARPRSRPRGG